MAVCEVPELVAVDQAQVEGACVNTESGTTLSGLNLQTGPKRHPCTHTFASSGERLVAKRTTVTLTLTHTYSQRDGFALKAQITVVYKKHCGEAIETG